MLTEARVKAYLDYLDKEMNIMGILSTFCAGVVALVADKAVSAKADEGRVLEILEDRVSLVFLGSVLIILAAFFFYSQRSLLAWYYGQISLYLAQGGRGGEDWLKEADSWATWLRYRVAFSCLGVGFLEYGLSLYPNVTDLKCFLRWSRIAPCAVTAVVLIPWLLVLRKYRYEDEPFKIFWARLLRVVKRKIRY